MSLVNLSHVCSHLQNASLARLGLTSIPYSRLHLRLSLLLLKQGFVSQVKLAGPSPPASCFPPGADNHYITSHPHAERGQRTPEAALEWIVNEGPSGSAEGLRSKGFPESAIEFAMSRREKSVEQLRRERWHEQATTILLRHEGKSDEQMRSEGFSEDQIALMDQYRPVIEECKQKLEARYGSREEYEAREKVAAEKAEDERAQGRNVNYRPIPYDRFMLEKLVNEFSRTDFDVDTLRFFAGENRFVSRRGLDLDGIDVEAMGLTIPNQPFDAPAPETAADPLQLEEEGVVTQANRASRRLWLGMKYWDGVPVLRKAKMLSKPTKRIHLNEHELGRLVRGKQAGEVKPLTQVGEIMAINTQLGVLEIRECVERKLGGMALCRIW